MALILTTTCDYALLVVIAEGAGFPSLNDRDIFLHSRLALHLPDTVGDLIPPSTIISAKPTKLTPTPQWRTTLVYFLSAKLLDRLKRRCAQVTLHVMTITEQGSMHELGTVILRVDHAKTIKASQKRNQQSQWLQETPLNVIKNYVIDKGDWKSVIQAENATTTVGSAQIKVGLFIVEMPLHSGEQQRREMMQPSVRHPPHPPHHHHHQPAEDSSNNLDDMGLEIHSVNSSDDMMATNLSYFINTNDNDRKDKHTMERHSIPATPSSSSTTATSSSLLSSRNNVNKKETVVQKSSSSSSSIKACFRVIQHNNGPFPYLQLGSGSQRYTFILRLVEATAVMSLIPLNLNNHTIRQWVQYTFSDWQIKHDVITKANAWLITDQPMCLSLQGHLHDLQQWLSQQGPIEVCLMLAATDKVGKGEFVTIGKSMIRLNGWCPVGKIEQASFPIHDRSNRLHVDPPFQFARVVVQLGLVDGWENYLDGQPMNLGLVNSNSNNSNNSSNSRNSSSDSLVQQQNHPFLHQQNLIK